MHKPYTRLAIAIVMTLGFFVFYIGTDGFQAYTAETARLIELQENKPALPNVGLEDSKGRSYSFKELTKDKYVFITFMYTSCGTVCPQLEMNMSQVYDLIPEGYFDKDIVFLSISFDPERDTPEVLANYRSFFDSDGETWRMARINDRIELNHLLEKLGVIVIPDGYGNFQHNSAFYLIDRDGQLKEVMDFKKINEAARTVINYLQGDEGEKL